MRKIYLFAASLFLAATTFGQNPELTNPSFEKWSIDSITGGEIADGWIMPDAGMEILNGHEGMSFIGIPVTKGTTGATEGNFYLKLETFELQNSIMSDFQDGIYGGLAGQYFQANNEKIVSFSMDIACDVKNGDRAIILLEGYDANDNIVSQGVARVTESTEGAFEKSVKITMTEYEDVAIEYYFIGIASSETEFLSETDAVATVGSWIAVDNITYKTDADDSDSGNPGDGTSSLAVNTKDIKVFPNPANNFVTFQVDGLENGKVVISSITGQEVMNTSLNGVTKVNVSALNNGVYIYKITNANGELVRTNKLIIQK